MMLQGGIPREGVAFDNGADYWRLSGDSHRLRKLKPEERNKFAWLVFHEWF
jgi:hypothetical protein